MKTCPHNRILVIDDNRAIHDDFRKILGPSDTGAIDLAEASFFGDPLPGPAQPVFEIDSAYQGEEGIAFVRKALNEERPYSLAFVDVRMPPGMDGIETAAKLWEICPDLQIVICTAYTDYSWQEMVGRLGTSDRLLVLKKPFAAVEALQLACSLTEKWSLGQQARQRLEETERIVELRTRELREANQRLEAEMGQRQRAEEQLLRAQRLESIGTLASGLAHDLNNALAPIVMAAPMLRGDRNETGFGELVSMIETSAERATGIIRQVLTFARGVEGERVTLNPADSLAEMEKIALETFPRSIRIDCRKPGDLWPTCADATQLQQVLMNLCINARDAMPQGGTLVLEANNFEAGEACVNTIPGARVGRYVVFRVSDTGTGISRSVRERIFDPFFTTKPLGEGTGLGLSAVAGIVKSHEGFFDVHSEPGAGSTFEIFIPAATSVRQEAVSAPAISAGGADELILVVDDEQPIRDMVATILKRNGYRTVTAVNGAEAVTVYAENASEIRAVLTDVMMPGLNGVELCRSLRSIDAHVPIIASTGNGEASQASELRTLNVNRLLSKPYRSSELLATLHEALVS